MNEAKQTLSLMIQLSKQKKKMLSMYISVNHGHVKLCLDYMYMSLLGHQGEEEGIVTLTQV